MPRPVTLFTGQWADLPLAELAPLAKSMGYDGLELACWGDHFDVAAGARASTATSRDKRALLEAHGLQCYAISQPPRRPGRVRPDRRAAPGDPAAARVGRRRPRGRAPARRRGDRADTATRRRARSASKRRQRLHRLERSGTRIYAFPPTAQDYWDAGFARLRQALRRRSSTRSTSDGVNFALEVHPTEIAFDIASAAARARGGEGPHALRLQLRPRHLGYQGVDYVEVHPHASPTASTTST